ncbi:hypothetical protein PVP01_0901300 [Plasmodium vivax]|uniref:Uncharacterized protein n=1 Tax=Plasmodium vivax TaxID=5855 RepID=A0A564ZV41_PLAVI|nr:hypothetical protein PVP01_0901300 [Plasmodium vivax]
MEKNKEEYNESSERYKTCLYQLVYCKSSQPRIQKSDIFLEDSEKIKNTNPRFSSNELAFSLFNSFRSCSYNNVRTKFVKLIGIYQLFVLRFSVAESQEGSEGTSYEKVIVEMKNQAEQIWKYITQQLCVICSSIGNEYGNICGKDYVAIPVVVFLFLFVFGIICLICCKCCCKKSRKKKASDDSSVNHDQFIMGPDGQMYSQMYQGQMVQPQMIPAGMMYPQMYLGQMYYPQMLQQGMQQPEMQYMEMQQPEMQYMEMQQPEMQYMEMQQP